jgi:glycosyltransferase involved in cell wall biosynthesis
MIYHFTYGFDEGGLEHLLLKVLNNSDEKRITLVILSNKQRLVSRLSGDVKVERLVGLKRTILFLISMINKPTKSVLYFWSYPTIPVSILIKLLGCRNLRIVWNIHSKGDYLRLKSKIIFLLAGIFSRFVPDKILFASLDAQRYHQKMLWSKKRSLVFRHGLSVAKFAPKVKKSVGGKLRIGSVGRYDPVKNHHQFVRSITNLPKKTIEQVEFHFFGVTAKELFQIMDKSKVSRVSNAIRARGFVTQTDAIFNEFDILFIHSRSEAMPLVFLEAVERGKVVFSTNVGDLSLYLPENHVITDITDIAFGDVLNDVISQKTKNYSYLDPYYAKVISDHNLNDMLSSYETLQGELIMDKSN